MLWRRREMLEAARGGQGTEGPRGWPEARHTERGRRQARFSSFLNTLYSKPGPTAAG